jgi:hypothetical protein
MSGTHDRYDQHDWRDLSDTYSIPYREVLCILCYAFRYDTSLCPLSERPMAARSQNNARVL